jgi:hypothetical protein
MLYGWVVESRKQGQVHISIAKGTLEPAQEQYELALSSRLGSATVPGVFAMGTDECAVFAVPKIIEIMAPSSASRIATPAYQVTVSFDGKVATGALLDIANAGVGLRTSELVPKGTMATIEIQAAFGRKSIVGISTHSATRDDMGAGWYRTGFRVDASNRLSQANWKFIFDFVVEQAIIEAQISPGKSGCTSSGISTWRNRAA